MFYKKMKKFKLQWYLVFLKTYWDSKPCFSRNCIALSEKFVNPAGEKEIILNTDSFLGNKMLGNRTS